MQLRQVPKVLYRYEETTPDNCSSDDGFLNDLRTNVSLSRYTFTHAARNSLIVSLQLNAVLLFGLLVWSVPTILLNLLVASSIALFLLYFYVSVNRPDQQIISLRDAAIYLGYGWLLAPVFKTLTASISSDTLCAIAAALFILHLASHNYCLSSYGSFAGAVSVNSAICAAVCLVSRLDSTLEVFFVMILAAQIFVLWPMVRNSLLISHPRALVPMSLCMGFIVTLAAAAVSYLFLLYFVLFHVFLNLLCPFTFVQMQRLKNTIHGPWDEAVIIED